ncbi:DUF3883 domain-containing protein [Enhygromyxa salina]|uniref:Protein NO VEIN C-terminal domain-containing protein n=1 Tax=Enhygromyxa salina TaxID=215803 RepID=A0A2S9YDE2_9BACT|nr:DUF3883 domain-containing protein [Enhygromyxa salina]PRQ03124.1 hypothetical protein ENSA7_53950 [Enhygromyxa salina]
MSDAQAPSSLCDADGNRLSAQFSIVPDEDGQFSLLFESAGGPKRNRDYGEALGIALERLGRAHATLTRIEVVSREALARPLNERTVEPEGYKLPLALMGVEDYLDLRKKIGAGVAKTAQRRVAKKSSSGNSQKRLRLVLRFKPELTPEIQALVRVIERAPKYDTQPLLTSTSQDAARTGTKRASASNGQGFEQDVQTKLAVEEYAMRQAEKHYAQLGWQAHRRDKEKGLGYDIEFTKDKQRLCVEVKGTRTAGARVIVTSNEVEQAHAESERSVLFVVADIKVSEGLICSGGQVSLYERWDPKAREKLLMVKDYWYELPKEGGMHYAIGSESKSGDQGGS